MRDEMNEKPTYGFAGRGIQWWTGVIGLGLLFGIMAYLKTLS